MADVRIDKSVASIPEQLINRVEGVPGGGVKLFETMAEVLVFAALLGKSNNKKEPVTEPRSDPIRFSIFENKNLDSYVYLLAVNETSDFDLLTDEKLDEAILSFESYAFGGLKIIQGWMEKSGKGLYESILEQMSLVAMQRSSEEDAKKPRPKIIQKKSRKVGG